MNDTGLAQEIERLKAENERLRAVNAELLKGCMAGKAAHNSIFEQCLSNPITNAWGKEVNCTLINEGGELCGDAIAKARASERQ